MNILEKIYYTWAILVIPMVADSVWISINAYMGNRAGVELTEREGE